VRCGIGTVSAIGERWAVTADWSAANIVADPDSDWGPLLKLVRRGYELSSWRWSGAYCYSSLTMGRSPNGASSCAGPTKASRNRLLLPWRANFWSISGGWPPVESAPSNLASSWCQGFQRANNPRLQRCVKSPMQQPIIFKSAACQPSDLGACPQTPGSGGTVLLASRAASTNQNPTLIRNP